MGYMVPFLTMSSILIDMCFTNLIFIGAMFNSYNYWYLLSYSNQFTLHYSMLFLIISIMIILLKIMFLGYLLCWGQMSYWGITVMISSLFILLFELVSMNLQNQNLSYFTFPTSIIAIPTGIKMLNSFILESFSIISQSLTLSNRLSINILAGSLLISSLSVTIMMFSGLFSMLKYLSVRSFSIILYQIEPSLFIQQFDPYLSIILYQINLSHIMFPRPAIKIKFMFISLLEKSSKHMMVSKPLSLNLSAMDIPINPMKPKNYLVNFTFSYIEMFFYKTQMLVILFYVHS